MQKYLDVFNLSCYLGFSKRKKEEKAEKEMEKGCATEGVDKEKAEEVGKVEAKEEIPQK